MTLRNTGLFALALLFPLAFALQAQATEFDLGATAGAAILSGGAATHATFGLEGDYQLVPALRTGLFYNYTSLGTINTTGISASASISFFGVQGYYDLSASVPGLSVGAKVALGWDSSNASGVVNEANTNTNFYVGPLVAFDVPIGAGFTVGAEANILFTPSSNPNAVNLLGTVRFWF